VGRTGDALDFPPKVFVGQGKMKSLTRLSWRIGLGGSQQALLFIEQAFDIRQLQFEMLVVHRNPLQPRIDHTIFTLRLIEGNRLNSSFSEGIGDDDS
jgi:hypothetical protein